MHKTRTSCVQFTRVGIVSRRLVESGALAGGRLDERRGELPGRDARAAARLLVRAHGAHVPDLAPPRHARAHSYTTQHHLLVLCFILQYSYCTVHPLSQPSTSLSLSFTSLPASQLLPLPSAPLSSAVPIRRLLSRSLRSRPPHQLLPMSAFSTAFATSPLRPPRHRPAPSPFPTPEFLQLPYYSLMLFRTVESLSAATTVNLHVYSYNYEHQLVRVYQ